MPLDNTKTITSVTYNGNDWPVGGGGGGMPIEISTAAEMDAVLIAVNVGKVYMFIGTTDATYTNGDLYIVEAV